MSRAREQSTTRKIKRRRMLPIFSKLYDNYLFFKRTKKGLFQACSFEGTVIKGTYPKSTKEILALQKNN